MEWYLKVVRDNYANFNGRARRKEYWMFVLINLIISLALYSLVLIGAAANSSILASIGGLLYFVYALGIILPSIAVAVRRLHDVGKSGWYLLVAFIPLVGPIWLLVLLATDSQIGSNEYGANPKTGDTIDEHLVEN